MIGDINMFLTPWENDEDESESGRLGVDHVRQSASQGSGPRYCVGEVDIMIANVEKRGRGMGRAAVSTFLWFVKKNVRGILAEYATSIGEGDILEMKELLVRIKATNEGSIALFKGYGFEQRGEVNYFGEVAMILKESSSLDGVKGVEGYEELQFDRSGLSK